MEREAFSKELGDWEQLARLVEIHGSDREKVVSELIAHLQVVQLPDEFTKALDWFMVGVAKGSSDQVE
jgi:hypothetical protein